MIEYLFDFILEASLFRGERDLANQLAEKKIN
jgi:hypothetical protein